MADASTMAANKGVKPTVSVPNVQTNYPSMFHADRLSADISGWIKIGDGLSRGTWTFNVVGIGGPISTITGFIEGTMDHTNPYTIASFTQATAMPLNVQNIVSQVVRARVTSFTPGAGCIGYRIGMAFTGT